MLRNEIPAKTRVFLEGTAHVALGFCWKTQKTRVFAAISLRSKVLSKGLRVILYKRRFRLHRKTGTEKQDRAEKQRACFSFTRFRNELRKNRVSLVPCRFSLTREKRERKKQDEVFKDVLVAKDIYLLHHDAQDLHAPKY